jgi:hypothetical protein
MLQGYTQGSMLQSSSTAQPIEVQSQQRSQLC